MNNLNNFECPSNHYDIASSLLSGRFILYGEILFNDVSNNLKYYKDFFNKSYGYELIKTAEAIYLSSSNTTENFSKDLMLVLAILVYEFNLHNKNIHEELMSNHSVEKIEGIIKNSSYSKVCGNISMSSLINKCRKRNLIKSVNDEIFRFTNAIYIFLEHAKKISEVENKSSKEDQKFHISI